ncbi:MAG: siderophore-interacting protein [Verrucomicrobium sp.]|nr:siderophore-interacting protein [Verrucomicrobium sp.]
MKGNSPARQPRRVAHDIVAREVQVARVEAVSPRFRAVTFTGESLSGFASPSFDDHVKFMFQDASGQTVRRDYTPRRFDPASRELTLEFGLHGGGLSSSWARQAQPGQAAVIAGPKGSLIIPADYEWHVLAGDCSALPAISRRLEELPPGVLTYAVVQLDDPRDQRAFAPKAGQIVQWTFSTEEFLSTLRSIPASLPGEGFVWCAGEASAMLAARHLFLEERGLPPASARIAAYWKKDSAGYHENLVAH